MTYHSPSHPFLECGVNILPQNEKSRRSPSANSSVGIRASALDFQMDKKCGHECATIHDENHRVSTKALTMQLESLLNRLFKEQLESLDRRIHLLEKKSSPKKERSHEELELYWQKNLERAKKRLREKEKRQKEEQQREKESEECLVFDNLMVQEPKEVFPMEMPSYELPCLKRKAIDIIPSAPLLIQPTFEEEEAKEDKEIQKIEDDRQKTSPSFLNVFKADTVRIHMIHCLNVWVYYYKKKASSMLMEFTKSEFVQFVFDPGGYINGLDSRTNPFEEGGFDVILQGQLSF